MKYDPLEADSTLTIHDYYFLKGDTGYWPGWGAAFGVVADWCKGHGYGDFGKPTERGKKAIEAYEKDA